MSRGNNYHDDEDQEQKQDQKQAELQAQLQAQLQGQAQGQGQGQGQYQFALSENKNENDNENENKNENSNENNLENDVENKLESSVDNKVDNDVDNDVENKVENTVENRVDTEVNVDVKVDLDIDEDALGIKDEDVIDIDWIKDIDGSIVMPDVVEQKMDDGNMFNIDQVNNLVDKDFLYEASVKNDGEVKWDIKAEGGEAKIDDIDAKIDGVSNTMGDVGTATADALATQEAFTQNIVLGANIQFNQIDITAAGDSLTSGPADDIS